MKMEMGVWIDRRQAVIVTLLDEKEEIRRIRSNIDRHSLYWRASQPQSATAPRDPLAEENRSRQISNRMGGYYDAVFRWLSIADSIMIFGSGEPQHELQKRLLQHEMSGRVVGVRTTDTLTAREFAMEVRYQFNALSQQPADTKTETE